MARQTVQLEPPAFVGTQAAQTRVANLRARPGAAERVGRIRAEMATGDRAEDTARPTRPSATDLTYP